MICALCKGHKHISSIHKSLTPTMKLVHFLSLFSLLSLSLIIIRSIGAVAYTFNATHDKVALLTFKSLLKDPDETLSSWSSDSPHICQWRGVTCSLRHKHRVVALDLGSLNLSGSISAHITNLTFLRRIRLANNQLHGPIPHDLDRLAHLKYLNLSMNSLEGEIPASLSRCSHLQVTNLRNNNLQGEIPSNLTQCSMLRNLNLGSNRLSGEIPTEFGSFQNLEILRLEGNKLSGNIPTLLGSSSSLKFVDLTNNSLIGPISPFLANSSSLVYLGLANNLLKGGIPPSIGNSSSIKVIWLSGNSLTGAIPTFSSLTASNLRYLGLSSNHLSGQIPHSLGNLSSLIFLSISSNWLQGSIPNTIGSITTLQALDISVNNFSGIVPSSIYNISSLVYLGLGSNDLCGTLPSRIGFTLPNLQTLEMRLNHFQGPIPASLCNASRLQYIVISGNNFSGPIPSNFGFLRDLRKLFLGFNQIEAHDLNFFTSLTNCSHLKILHLQNNKLEGTLPMSIGNFSVHLEGFFIGENNISGPVPDEIGNLVGLTVLYMDQTLLNGKIPSTIGKLRNLHVLNLSGSRFSGTIPASLGNLTQLNELCMEENEFNGLIPPDLGRLNLEKLKLSHNSLSGSIPKEIVSLSSLTRLLDLSHNYLSGFIPIEVGILVNLVQLDFSNNRLEGEITPTIGSCLLLQNLYLGNNFFRGPIPQSIVTLKGLTELDLSCNNLSGRIPDFLETLRSLQYLNLSFNDLNGEVPRAGVFGNASRFSIVGNKGLCGGQPILRLPSCHVQSSERRRLKTLIIIIIPIASAVLLSLLIFGIFFRLQRATEKYPFYSSSQDDNIRKVSYAEIVKATDNFASANILGSGSFGNVYRGKISLAENYIAVKVFNVDWGAALKSFIAECEVLRNIRHRNLVKIITSCSSVDFKGHDFKALIYEYMPNGSLDKWLHPEGYNPQIYKLNFMQRLYIAADVASALEYLHHNCMPPVVHCDLKPSNVLLDNDMTAHVGDFGLARFLTTTADSTSLMGIKGSIGYVAPEYGVGNHISTQGDVYSYGVLLLGLLTGKRPTDDMFRDGLNLHNFVEMAFPDKIIEILDPQILHEEGDDIRRSKDCAGENKWTCIVSLIRVGLCCSHESPNERMEMKDAAKEICANKYVYSVVENYEVEDI